MKHAFGVTPGDLHPCPAAVPGASTHVPDEFQQDAFAGAAVKINVKNPKIHFMLT